MKSFYLPLQAAREIARLNVTTLDHILSNGGDLYLQSGAKIVVNAAGSKKVQCTIISYCWDLSDVSQYKHLGFIPKEELVGAIA